MKRFAAWGAAAVLASAALLPLAGCSGDGTVPGAVMKKNPEEDKIPAKEGDKSYQRWKDKDEGR